MVAARLYQGAVLRSNRFTVAQPYGLNVNARSLTLKNAVWSRAVQHGSGGCLNLFAALYAADPSFVSLDDLTIVTRLYEESGAVVNTPPYSTVSRL